MPLRVCARPSKLATHHLPSRAQVQTRLRNGRLHLPAIGPAVEAIYNCPGACLHSARSCRQASARRLLAPGKGSSRFLSTASPIASDNTPAEEDIAQPHDTVRTRQSFTESLSSIGGHAPFADRPHIESVTDEAHRASVESSIGLGDGSDDGKPRLEDQPLSTAEKTGLTEHTVQTETRKSTRKTKSKSKGTRKDYSDYSSSAVVVGKHVIFGTDLRGPSMIERRGPKAPTLSRGLDQALFNPGVFFLQDSRSGVFNFDPDLARIMPLSNFDFSALSEYKTSSKDEQLTRLAREQGRKYFGSTSSMTSVLCHFHFLISAWRPPDLSCLSRGFPLESDTYSKILRAPAAILLRHKDGKYAIDADKEYDSSSVLMIMGKMLEKQLTLSKPEMDRYRIGHPNPLSDAEKPEEVYQYSTFQDFLMRAQLDARDPRLPGSGIFDIKTRAVLPIRMDVNDYERRTGYEIRSRFGEYNSFEREYFDMVRAVMLKYSLQVRMGGMEGIYVAYHNVQSMLGFHYIDLEEMDQRLHGQANPTLGSQEFSVSLNMLNEVLNRATQRFPNTTIRLHFETRPLKDTTMYIFAEPITEETADAIQNTNQETVKRIERILLRLNDEEPHEIQRQAAEAVEELVSKDISETGQAAEDDQIIVRNSSSFTSIEADLEELAVDPARATVDADEEGECIELAGEGSAESVPFKPLLAYKVTITNVVDGINVIRPEKLTSRSDWNVSYTLKEVEDPKRGWHLYHQLRERRRSQLLHPQDLHPDGPQPKFLDPFQMKMRSLAARGATARKMRDRRNRPGSRLVWFRPIQRRKPLPPAPLPHHLRRSRRRKSPKI